MILLLRNIPHYSAYNKNCLNCFTHCLNTFNISSCVSAVPMSVSMFLSCTIVEITSIVKILKQMETHTQVSFCTLWCDTSKRFVEILESRAWPNWQKLTGQNSTLGPIRNWFGPLPISALFVLVRDNTDNV